RLVAGTPPPRPAPAPPPARRGRAPILGQSPARPDPPAPPEASVRSTVEPVEPTKLRINVVVEPEELASAIDRTARRLANEVRVPGFRKGKVPRRVIEARIGRDALVAEAIEHGPGRESYPRATEEHGAQPLTRAQVDTPDWQEGAPLEFTATVEV